MSDPALFLSRPIAAEQSSRPQEMWVGRPKAAQARAMRPGTSGGVTPSPTPSRTPSPQPPSELGEQAAVDLFYASGFEYDDAVTLGELWNVDPWEAKAEGGRWLDEGRELPGLP